MNLFSKVAVLLSSAGILVTSLLHLHHTEKSLTTSQTPTPSQASYHATGNFAYQGYKTTVTMTIPKNGGEIAGTLSGTCTGDITGTYDGPEKKTVHGQGTGNCSAMFITIPVTAPFTGIVDTAEKTMHLTIDVKTDAFEKTESLTLPISS